MPNPSVFAHYDSSGNLIHEPNDNSSLNTGQILSAVRGLFGTTSAVFGDSYSARVNASGVPYRQSDHSYWTWANLLLGSPFTLIGNFGVAGNTTEQMLARIDAVKYCGASVTFVQGGVNDLAAGISPYTVAANLITIANTLKDYTKVCLLNIAPNATYYAGILIVNTLLANYARSVGNVVLVDVFASVVDSTSVTGAFATNMSNDNLHLTVAGAYQYGAAIAAALSKIVAVQPFLVNSAADSYAIDASSLQILTNPLMSGSAGTVSGTGASGTLASNWAAGTDSGTVTSVWLHGQARSDGIGVDQQVTCTNAGASATINFRQTFGLTARVAAGDYIYGSGCIALSGMTDVARVQPSLTVTIGGVTSVVHCLDNSDTTWPQSNMTLNWRTPSFLLTDVPTALQLFIRIRFGSSGAGACVAKFGRTAVYKYTQ